MERKKRREKNFDPTKESQVCKDTVKRGVTKKMYLTRSHSIISSGLRNEKNPKFKVKMEKVLCMYLLGLTELRDHFSTRTL